MRFECKIGGRAGCRCSKTVQERPPWVLCHERAGRKVGRGGGGEEGQDQRSIEQRGWQAAADGS